MPAKNRNRAWLVAAPLLAYWLTLLALSIAIAAGLLPALLLPPLFIIGLPIVIDASRAIRNTVRYSDLAYTDDLTGAANRRAFQRDLDALLSTARQGNLGLILLDVDALKQINDGCGHQAGDELLRGVARRLSAAGAALYRLGGDEFALLVDRRSGLHLSTVMRHLQPYTSSFKSCGHDHAVHLSSGIGSNLAGDGFDTLVRRADQRLTQSKRRLRASQAAAVPSMAQDASAPGAPDDGAGLDGSPRRLRLIN